MIERTVENRARGLEMARRWVQVPPVLEPAHAMCKRELVQAYSCHTAGQHCAYTCRGVVGAGDSCMVSVVC